MWELFQIINNNEPEQLGIFNTIQDVINEIKTQLAEDSTVIDPFDTWPILPQDAQYNNLPRARFYIPDDNLETYVISSDYDGVNRTTYYVKRSN